MSKHHEFDMLVFSKSSLQLRNQPRANYDYQRFMSRILEAQGCELKTTRAEGCLGGSRRSWIIYHGLCS